MIYTYHIPTPYMSPGLPQRPRAALGPVPGPVRARSQARGRAALGSLREAWAHVRCMYVVCIYA